MKYLFWRYIRWKLTRYVAKRPFIEACYIRHTASFQYPNPLLSDFDTAFFVRCDDIQTFRELSIKIVKDFRTSNLRRWIPHAIVLPSSAAAFDACKHTYPLRALYPFSSWISVQDQHRAERPVARTSLPLDHTPESFFITHVIPILKGELRQHPLEPLFLWRKARQYQGRLQKRNRNLMDFTITGAIHREVNSWDYFYSKLIFNQSEPDLPVKLPEFEILSSFRNCWELLKDKEKLHEVVQSIWLYPSSIDDKVPSLVINFFPKVSPYKMRTAVDALITIFKSVRHSLLIGTEQSMVQRINGLSRLALFEPWLIKHAGVCLLGDASIISKIIEPSKKDLAAKYQEFLLYFNYRRVPQFKYPYAMYRMAYSMDFLLRHGSLVMDQEELSNMYGNSFIKESEFNCERAMQSLLDFTKEKHGFSVFDTYDSSIST